MSQISRALREDQQEALRRLKEEFEPAEVGQLAEWLSLLDSSPILGHQEL